MTTNEGKAMAADKVVVFRDDNREWRWHRVAANGERTATSGEAFDSKANALRAALREAAGWNAIVVVDDNG